MSKHHATCRMYVHQRDQASLDSARRVYELDVKAHMRRCEDAAKMRTTAAAARYVA